jgi:hypothetical protein
MASVIADRMRHGIFTGYRRTARRDDSPAAARLAGQFDQAMKRKAIEPFDCAQDMPQGTRRTPKLQFWFK